MNILKDNECKGCCFDDNIWANICRIDGVGLAEICPCRKCVVKIMCRQICEPYRILRLKTERMKYKNKGAKRIRRGRRGKNCTPGAACNPVTNMTN